MRVLTALMVSCLTSAAFSQTAEEAPCFRAQIKAVHQTLISTETPGQIAVVRMKDGERLKKGDVLLTYDCEIQEAMLARSRAAEEAARGKLAAAEDLRKLGSISRTDFAEARAALLTARAETRIESTKVKKCAVTTPLDGMTGEVFVRPYEYVTASARLISVFDTVGFEVELILPSAALARIRPGTKMTVAVDETGDVLPAEVLRIAGSIDPVSQSVKVTGSILADKKSRLLWPGMSGAVWFSASEVTP